MKDLNLKKKVNVFLQRRFRLVAISSSAALLALGYFLLLAPKVTNIREVGSINLASTTTQLELKQQIVVSTSSLVEKYRQLTQERLQSLAAVLPPTSDVSSLFVEADALATAAGLKLKTVSFAELSGSTASTTQSASVPTPGSSSSSQTITTKPAAASTATSAVKTIAVTMNVTGGRGYEDLKRFLSTLESNVRLLDVQSLVYNPVVSGEEQYQINAQTFSYTP